LLGRQGLLEGVLARLCTDPVANLPTVTVETIGMALRTSDLKADFPGSDSADSLAAFEVRSSSSVRDSTRCSRPRRSANGWTSGFRGSNAT